MVTRSTTAAPFGFRPDVKALGRYILGFWDQSALMEDGGLGLVFKDIC